MIPEKLIKLILPSLVKSWIYCQVFFSKQRMSSTWHHPAVSTIFKSQNFFFWLKNKRSLTLLKFFPYLLFSPSTKFWSSYIAWLYKKRTKLHTKEAASLIPSWLISTLPFWSLLSLIQPSLWSSIIPKIHSSYRLISKRSPCLSSSLSHPQYSETPIILLPYL